MRSKLINQILLMKKLLLITLFIFLCNQFLIAQGFINGSFETTTSTGCDYNNSITEFNSVMSNVVMFAGNETDIHEGGCLVTNLPDGAKVVGLAGQDAINLELTSPLITGVDYTLTFFKHANSFAGSFGDLEIGASTDANIMGAVIQTVVPGAANTWIEETFTFTAPNDATHISVRNVSSSPSYWNQIDNFSFGGGAINTPPIAVCQDITVQLDSAGNATIVAADVDGGSSDAEGTVTLSVDQDTFSCSDTSSPVQVILTVEDEDGATANCTAFVTVEDNIPTTITCPGDVTVNNDSGDCGAVVTYTDPVVVDNCGSGSAGNLMNVLDSFNANFANVTANIPTPYEFVMDATGGVNANNINDGTADLYDTGNFINTNISGSSNIQYSDNTIISSPSFGAGGQYFTRKVPNMWITAADLDAVSTFNISGNLGADGNGTADGFTSTITVGGENYTLLVKRVFNSGDPSVNHLIIIPENAGANQTFSLNTDNDQHDISGLGTTNRIYYLLFFSGVNNVTSIFVDNTTMETIASSFINEVTSSPSVTQTAGMPSGSTFPVGTTTNTFEYTDASGNTATCSFDVTVNDIEDPAAVCAADFTVQLDATGNASITVADIDNGSTDNCGIATTTIDITDFTCADVGVNTVTLTVTDVNGNSSTCMATVTVEDNTAPIIACAMDVEASTNPDSCFAEVFFANPLVTDNCETGDVTITQTVGMPSGSMFPVGVSQIAFEVTDTNGNSSQCSFTITVTDDTPPVAVCQDITVELDETGNVTITASQLNGGSTDNCNLDTSMSSIDIDTFGCADVGDNTVTLTVSDSSGNTATCTATVTVMDNTAPVVTCNDITVALGADGTVTLDPTLLDGGSSDACGITTLTASPAVLDCGNLGVTEVTLTATDVNGNSSSCTALVTVEDNIAPTLVCQEAVIELGPDGTATIDPIQLLDLSNPLDNCGVEPLMTDVTTVDCSDVGSTITVTVTAMDASGNTSSCTTTITVVDVTGPTFDQASLPVGPIVRMINPATGIYRLEDFTVGVTATDGCSELRRPIAVSQSPFAGTELDEGTYDITITAMDEAGNDTDYVFELQVQPALGVEDANLSSLTLYPNPASDRITLSNPNGLQLDKAAIYDLQGRLIQHIDLTDMLSEKTIDVSSLQSAAYMFVISSENGMVTKQIIKE